MWEYEGFPDLYKVQMRYAPIQLPFCDATCFVKGLFKDLIPMIKLGRNPLYDDNYRRKK